MIDENGMEDNDIIELYWARNEAAIKETSDKYGKYCHSVAFNILSIREDAQECVSDTWYKVWNAIPPERPNALRVWLGRIVRNLSLDRWRRDHAKKRFNGMDLILSELEECVPDTTNVEQSVEATELSHQISNWLDSLQVQQRNLFIKRYWYGVPLDKLSMESGLASKKLAQQMFRLRGSLKNFLEKEGTII